MSYTRTRRGALLLAAIATLALAAPVGAITNGQPDGDDHPMVGQLFFYVPDEADPRFTDPGSWFNCSGTLISSTVLLTAGHCTFGTGLDGEPTTDDGGWGGNDVWVSFLEVPEYDGLPPSAEYMPDRNEDRYEDRVEWLNANTTWRRGTAYPHPDYDNDAFYLADAGVVILDDPIELEEYATLAPLNYLDQFTKKSKAQTLFMAVGYGLEGSLPIGSFGGDTRMTSQQTIINANGVYGLRNKSSIVFSNNNGTPHRGGTCSGDSGGPFFRDGTLIQVAINSYGVPPNCVGGDGGYRIDQPDDVEWIQDVLNGDDDRID